MSSLDITDNDLIKIFRSDDDPLISLNHLDFNYNGITFKGIKKIIKKISILQTLVTEDKHHSKFYQFFNDIMSTRDPHCSFSI